MGRLDRFFYGYNKGFLLGIALCLTISVSAQKEVFGKVVKIKDGDTFVLLLADKSRVTIRLAYIDCPEKGQAYYQKAKDYTSKMIFGSEVKCTLLKKEKYQRFLGIVYLPDGSQLNEILVRQGMAWDYKTYSAHTRMYMLEQKAREDKLGLWQDSAPLAPWEFRKKRR